MDNGTTRILDQPINIFNGVLDNDCSNIVKMSAVLNAIKNGKWKQEIEWYRQEEDKEERETIKKQFPGVTFSGCFKERRLDRNLAYYTNIMVVDIDLKDMHMNYDKTMDCVQKTPFIFCAFKSPSGGIKALAYSDMSAEDHKLYFAGVEEYFLSEYGIVIDTSGKNPGRLCFISYDPDMYLEFEDKRTFVLEEDGPKTFQTERSRRFEGVRNVDYSKYEKVFDARYIMDIAKKWLEKGGSGYHKGNRNNYIFGLSCIFNRAGVPEHAAIDIIFQRYNSLGQKEVENTVKSAYRHNKNEHGSKPITKEKNSQTKLN
jgi:BT4734-like, N-terminal domain/Primase C terminal 1 (PriCT-1)